MCPLNEVHRFIDEAHESSLRVGDLFELLREPVDRSFKPADPREPGLSVGQPVLVTEDLSVVVSDPLARPEARAPRGLDGHPARRDDRRGRTVGMRQDHLAADHDAAGPSDERDRRRSAECPWNPSRARRSGGLSATWARTRSSSPARSPPTSPMGRKTPPGRDPPSRRDGMYPRRDREDAGRLQGPRRGTGTEPLRRPATEDRPGPDLPEESSHPHPRRGDLRAGQHQREDRSSRPSTRPGATGP